MRRRTLVIPGGGGFLSRHVARHFADAGWRVIVLSRDRTTQIHQTEVAWWDGQTLGDWASHLDDADAVLNLAGRSVNCRYHARNRRIIEESRTRSTRVLGEAIAQSASPPCRLAEQFDSHDLPPCRGSPAGRSHRRDRQRLFRQCRHRMGAGVLRGADAGRAEGCPAHRDRPGTRQRRAVPGL